MQCAETAIVHPGASVSASARLGDYVVVYAGASVGDGAAVQGMSQLWPGAQVGAGVVVGPGVSTRLVSRARRPVVVVPRSG